MKNEAPNTTGLLTEAALLDIQAGWLKSMVDHRIDRDNEMVKQELEDATRLGAIAMQQDEQKRQGEEEPKILVLSEQSTLIDPTCVYRHIRELCEEASSLRDLVPV